MDLFTFADICDSNDLCTRIHHMHDIISYVPPLQVCWTFQLYQVSGCTFMFSHYWLIPYCEDVIVPYPFRNVYIDEHPIVECLVILALASHLALLLFRKLAALNLFSQAEQLQFCFLLPLVFFRKYVSPWHCIDSGCTCFDGQVSRCPGAWHKTNPASREGHSPRWTPFLI